MLLCFRYRLLVTRNPFAISHNGSKLSTLVNLLAMIYLDNLLRSGKYEEALEKFESVLGSKPELNEASIASYNVACCYSKLNQV